MHLSNTRSTSLYLTLGGLAVLGCVVLSGSASAMWYWLVGVPVLPQPWADLNNILIAERCRLAGVDPYTTLGCSYSAVYFNYPPAVLWLLEAAGLATLPLAALARGQALLALAALATLAWAGATIRTPVLEGVKSGGRSGWAVAAALLGLASPAAALAFERGNIDLTMLALCALGSALWLALPARLGRALGALLWLVAGALKLFPWLGWAALAWVPTRLSTRATQRSTWRVWVSARSYLLWQGALLLVYLAWQGAALARCLANTPADQGGVGAATFSLFAAVHNVPWLAGPAMHWLPVLVACGLAWQLRAWAKGLLASGVGSLPHFWGGLAVYAASWAAATSYDYRLVFLALPLLALWQAPVQARSAGAWFAALCLAMLWVGSLRALVGAHPAPIITLALFVLKFSLSLLLASH